MLVELPVAAIIALNLAGWPVIHVTVAGVFTRLPSRFFSSDWKCLRPHPSESGIYRQIGVRVWKQLLPDGAPWLDGFAKRELRSRDGDYLQRFIRETRRAEDAHWVMMSAGAVFIVWNPPWAIVVMAAYALAANLPCIITQRYNRLRLQSVFTRIDRRPARVA